MARHTVDIDVTARFNDELTSNAKKAADAISDVEDAAEAAKKDVQGLGKEKVNVDTSKAKKNLDDFDKKLKKLKGSDSTMVMRVKDWATDKVNKLISKVSKLGKSGKSIVLNVKDWATDKVNKLLSKLKGFGSKTYSAIVRIRDSNALSTLNKMSNGLKGIAGKTWHTAVKIKDYATAPLTKLKNMLFSIKSLVLAITAGLAAKQLVAAPIGLADQYSSAKIGFQTLLGQTEGQQMMDNLDEFAKATPFKSSQVIGQTQRMLAMGWDAENIIDDMTVIGDAAAATGKGEQGLQQIVTALAQIKTKGRLSTEELNQLAEAGVAAKKYIAEGLGYGSGDEGIAAMTKDLEDGAIASGAALTALLEGMKEYQGMMDRTANETVEGLWSQIQDTFEINILRRWGQGLQDGAKRGFGTIVQLLDKADGALEDFGDTLYDIGKVISNWATDKLENAMERITAITDTYEFQNASLGEKIKMLWNGVVADPFKEWFSELWSDEENVEKATEFGRKFAENLTKGILAILGITDIFEETGDGAETKGSNIAQGFAKGFVDGFDVSAITDKFVDAIGNVWNALPTWAKILIGGYAVGKAAGGIANFAGGVASFMGGVANTVGGFSIASSALPHLTSAGTGILGTLGKTGVALGASTTGGALLAGTAGIAGGAAGLVSAGSGVFDIIGAVTAGQKGDTVEESAKFASGGTKIGGVAAGATIGGLIGGPVGALLGAGIGGIAGWIGGNKWADNIRKNAAEAKYEIEGTADAIEAAASEEEKLAELSKAAWTSMKNHFGDIKLSASEIERIASHIVWGDDLSQYETFSSAVQNAEANLESLKTAAESSNKWMWKAALGLKFNDDEKESFKASFDEYISSAKSYVENKHYEFTAAVSLLVDVESEEGKNIIETGNAFYTKLQKQLDDLGSKLTSKIDIALEDGVITLNEHKEIINLQKQIAEITEKVANAEAQAELELIKVKFGSGKMDLESFDSFMEQMQVTLDERMAANDEAFKASVSSLQLQLAEGAITEDQYNEQLQTLIDGYTGKVDSIKADVMAVELDIIGDAYKDVLGKDPAKKLQNALEQSLAEGINPKNWTVEEAKKFLGIDDLKDDTAKAISSMLGGVADQLELVEVDGKLLLDLGVETEEEPDKKVKETLEGSIPEEYDTQVTMNLTAFKNIQNHIDILAEEFGIPDSIAQTLLWKLAGTKGIENKIDVLCEDFGINKEEAQDILWKLSGLKSIENKVGVTASEFGIPNSVSKTIKIKLKGSVTTYGNPKMDYASKQMLLREYRGGIVGGSSAMDSFYRGGIAGYTDGGMVRGGSQLVTVAEEGTPEMIIPLGSHRRERAMKLWAKTGEMLNAPGFARGGRTDGGKDEGIRFHQYGGGDAGGQTVQIEVGGITVEINVDATNSENIAEVIKAQAQDIAETVAGVLADAIGGQFENTPAKGGAA